MTVPPPVISKPPARVLVPFIVTVPAPMYITLPAVDEPPCFNSLLNVNVPSPANVTVLDVLEDAVVSEATLLNTNPPPAA
jgi:hypothetical protein